MTCKEHEEYTIRANPEKGIKFKDCSSCETDFCNSLNFPKEIEIPTLIVAIVSTFMQYYK